MSDVVGRLPPPLGAVREVLRNPDLRWLELAFLGFNMAEWATWVAILVYAYEVGGPTAVGLVAVVQLVPAAIAAPFMALIGDRGRRERVLVAGYLVQAAAMGATAAAMLTGAPISVTYVLAAVAATSITVTRPVQGALLPTLVRTPEQLTAANATSSAVEGLSILAGPALAGLLLGVASPGIVFAVMGGACLGSAALAALIRPATDGPAHPQVGHGVVVESLRGFRALAARPEPRLVVGLGGANLLVFGALDVLIVVLALELLDVGSSGVGYLNSAVGCGVLLGGMATFALIGRRRLAPPLALGTLVRGAPIALVGIVPDHLVVPLLLAATGAGHSLMDVAGRTLLQRIVPDEILSRVFGVLEGLAMAGLAVGSILAPLLVAGLGIRGAFLAVGALLPILGALAWRRLRAVDAAAPAPTKEVALLRPLPMFHPLSAQVLERLAADLVPVRVGAGAEVIRQGDVGDRFYLVAVGELRVTVDGTPVRVLGPGDHFGEIALLRDVPRTATVTARSDAELYALGREEFVAAVTGHPLSVEAVDPVIATRLDPQEVERP